MDLQTLHETLKELPLGHIHYANTTGSTNDDALALAKVGVADLTLFVADEQTAGRGRLNRRWYTPAGAALAFSLVLRSIPAESSTRSIFSIPGHFFPRLNGLGAISVAETLIENYRLKAQVKWPNDILVDGRKVAGVLVDAVWIGEQIGTVVIGIGVNVKHSSVPPPELVNAPADCIENFVQQAIDRQILLRGILQRIIFWRDKLVTDEFLNRWNNLLAFRGKWVQITTERPGEIARIGYVIGLDERGFLRLHDREGKEFTLQSGDVRIIL